MLDLYVPRACFNKINCEMIIILAFLPFLELDFEEDAL